MEEGVDDAVDDGADEGTANMEEESSPVENSVADSPAVKEEPEVPASSPAMDESA